MPDRKRKPRTKAQKAVAAKQARERRRANRGPAKRRGTPPKIEETVTFTNPETRAEETIKRTELILRLIRTGVPQRYAAQAAGIEEHTLSRWKQRGAEALVFAGGEVEDVPEAERSYAHFVQEIVRAKGTAVSFFVAQLHKQASKGSARAAIEWLRAQAADEFKKKVSVDVEGGDRKPAPLVPEDQAAYRRAFARAYGDELPELDPGELAPPDDFETTEEVEEG